jgi:hypothetical protein
MPVHLTGATRDCPLQPPGTRRRTLTTFDREMMKIHERRATWLHRSCLRAIFRQREQTRRVLQLRDSTGLAPASPFSPGIRTSGHPS